MDKNSFTDEISDVLMMAYRLNRAFSQGREDDCPNTLSQTQVQALIMVHRQGVLNMSQLAKAMMVTRQQLTKIVDALVEKGMVERGADPHNRRHVMISASEQGDQFLHKLFMEKTALFSERLDALGEGQSERMLEAIRTIKDILYRLYRLQNEQ